MTSFIATFLWIGMIVIFITLLVEAFEVARIRRDQRTIATILKQLEK